MGARTREPLAPGSALRKGESRASPPWGRDRREEPLDLVADEEDVPPATKATPQPPDDDAEFAPEEILVGTGSRYGFVLLLAISALFFALLWLITSGSCVGSIKGPLNEALPQDLKQRPHR